MRKVPFQLKLSASSYVYAALMGEGRREAHGIPSCLEHLEFAAEMMGADAGLNSDARWQVGELRFHLAARPVLPQHDGTAVIMTHDVE